MDNLKQFASTLLPKPTKTQQQAYKLKPWAAWDNKKGEEVALHYVWKEMKGYKMRYGLDCPPRMHKEEHNNHVAKTTMKCLVRACGL